MAEIFTALEPKFPRTIEYPVALGLRGKYCPRCLHYVAVTEVHCDMCMHPVSEALKIREHGERLAGSSAYCGSTE